MYLNLKECVKDLFTFNPNTCSVLQQCGPHGKEVDYSWPRQSMVTKQGYEVSYSFADISACSSFGTCFVSLSSSKQISTLSKIIKFKFSKPKHMPGK